MDSSSCAEQMSTALVPVTTPVNATAISEIQFPHEKTLKHAARLAIEQDKPILLDYYNDTINGKAFMGEDSESKEKMLVRSAEEYTSTIQPRGIFKVETDFIVITENSIYIIHGSTKKKTITAPSQ
jgi:hypothetical protein